MSTPAAQEFELLLAAAEAYLSPHGAAAPETFGATHRYYSVRDILAEYGRQH